MNNERKNILRHKEMKKAVSQNSALTMDFAGWVIPVVMIVFAGLWAYWATIVDLIGEWQENQDYSVGQLVPLVGAYLVWNRRKELSACRWGPGWWGIGIIVFGQLLRLFGLIFLYQSAERYSLVITLAGLVLLLAGPQVFYRLRWILLFLLLMVPLPGAIHNQISFPLQNQATAGAVFFLELMGISVVREGNVIWLNHQTPVAVAEACSGLRMLAAFVVVSATLAFIANRPRWQKAVLVLSGIPIAIGCNLIRLCVCSIFFLHVPSQVAEKVFHDFAGLIMMPLAIVILFLELRLMNKIVVPAEMENPSADRAQGDKIILNSKSKYRRSVNKK